MHHHRMSERRACKAIGFCRMTIRYKTKRVDNNAANAGIVTGGRAVRPDQLDMRWMGAIVSRNAEVEETGLGAGVLNQSARGVAWLPDYLQTANDEVCLLLQIESRAGLEKLDEIASTDGVDGVFIGPADLAADMGFLGKPGAPDVQAEVEKALKRIQAHGKAAGILTGDLALAKRYVELGATFVAIGNDVTLFANATSKLLADFKTAEAAKGVGEAKVY